MQTANSASSNREGGRQSMGIGRDGTRPVTNTLQYTSNSDVPDAHGLSLYRCLGNIDS